MLHLATVEIISLSLHLPSQSCQSSVWLFNWAKASTLVVRNGNATGNMKISWLRKRFGKCDEQRQLRQRKSSDNWKIPEFFVHQRKTFCRPVSFPPEIVSVAPQKLVTVLPRYRKLRMWRNGEKDGVNFTSTMSRSTQNSNVWRWYDGRILTTEFKYYLAIAGPSHFPFVSDEWPFPLYMLRMKTFRGSVGYVGVAWRTGVESERNQCSDSRWWPTKFHCSACSVRIGMCLKIRVEHVSSNKGTIIKKNVLTSDYVRGTCGS